MIDIKLTEEKILSVMGELCDEYNFARKAHAGSLMSLGETINKVTALLQFVSETDTRPANLTAPCANVISDINYNVEIIWIDYRGASKIYELACAIQDKLSYRRDLLVFKEGQTDTQHYSWADNLRFIEISDKDRGCFSYGFKLTIPYSRTIMRKLN